MTGYQQFNLPALVDSFPLVAQRFDPPKDVLIRASVVISCATGLKAKFYKDFALWLAQEGVGVVTYDYRYIGLSWPPHLREMVGRDVTLESRAAAFRAVPEDIQISTHWAQRDAAAALRYASERWPDTPLTHLGHSLGGVILPLTENERPLITRCINVCGGNIWVGNYSDPLDVFTRFKHNVYDHLEKDHIFYSSRLGLGEDIPYSLGKEWTQWFMSPRSAQQTPHAERLTREFDKPYLCIGFEDDAFNVKRLVHNLMAQFSHADGRKASLWINPAAQNPQWPACEHVTSFLPSRPTSTSPLPSSAERAQLTRQQTIWPIYRDWILHGKVIDPSVGEYRVWKPEDEFDPLEKSEFIYSLEDEEHPVRRRAPLPSTKL